MSGCDAAYVEFRPDGTANIGAGDARIYGVTERQIYHIALSILVHGPAEMRSDIQEWLNGGEIQRLAEVLAQPPQGPARNAGSISDPAQS